MNWLPCLFLRTYSKRLLYGSLRFRRLTTFLPPTYQRASTRCAIFHMNQVAQGKPHKIRSDPAVRLDVNQVGIASSARLLLKPNTKDQEIYVTLFTTWM